MVSLAVTLRSTTKNAVDHVRAHKVDADMEGQLHFTLFCLSFRNRQILLTVGFICHLELFPLQQMKVLILICME